MHLTYPLIWFHTFAKPMNTFSSVGYFKTRPMKNKSIRQYQMYLSNSLLFNILSINLVDSAKKQRIKNKQLIQHQDYFKILLPFFQILFTSNLSIFLGPYSNCFTVFFFLVTFFFLHFVYFCVATWSIPLHISMWLSQLLMLLILLWFPVHARPCGS